MECGLLVPSSITSLTFPRTWHWWNLAEYAGKDSLAEGFLSVDILWGSLCDSVCNKSSVSRITNKFNWEKVYCTSKQSIMIKEIKFDFLEEINMAIANVIQRGNACHVYNEKNSNIFTIPGELMGYTSTTVNVKRQHAIYTYNEKNQQIACRPA